MTSPSWYESTAVDPALFGEALGSVVTPVAVVTCGAFTGTAGDPFRDAVWTLEDGVPRLDGAASWVVCRLEDLLPGGDHLIAVGRVVHAGGGHAEPLLYGRNAFGTLTRLRA